MGPHRQPAALLALGGWAIASTRLLPVDAQAVPGDQLPVATRTHTFASYLTDPVLEPLRPVFASTVKVVRTYVDVRGIKPSSCVYVCVLAHRARAPTPPRHDPSIPPPTTINRMTSPT